ncbi:MAG: hypothetical protein K8S94_01860 [Planctomycetia bacterium]|nr:hypothetical protein [Planctomycetia bacterium]
MAFDAYRRCDPRARVIEESYLGVFQFGEDFAVHLAKTRSTRGFVGKTWSNFIWLDVDRDTAAGGVERAIVDTRQLLVTLIERYLVPEECLLPFISGGKGCHLGLPTALWAPAGGESYHLVARAFAERIATAAGIGIDMGVYDRVRAFRSPNSRHPRTGLHKKFVPPHQFALLTADDAVILAAQPAPFELPDLSGMGRLPALAAEWQAASETVAMREVAFEERRRDIATGAAMAKVNRLTLDLIRGEPVAVGDRHRTVYSASRNLAEAGAPRQLVFELLREAALDTGLPPREVDRQIECGFLAATRSASEPGPDEATRRNTPEGER